MISRRQLLSQSALLLALRVCGAGLVFACQVAIARHFGQDQLGRFIQAIAAASIIAALLPLGFQTIAGYLASEYSVKAQGGNLRAFLRQTIFQVIAVTAALLLAPKFIAGSFFARDFFKSVQFETIALMAVSLSLIFVAGSTLVGLKRPLLGYSADIIVRPLIMAGCVALAIFRPVVSDPIAALFWNVAAGCGVLALCHIGFAIRAAWNVGGSAQNLASEQRRWWRFALPWAVISLATEFFFDLDILLLSAQLSPSELAVFGAVTRMFSLCAFAIATVYSVSLPDIFESEAKSDHEKLLLLIQKTNTVALLMSCAATLGALLFGGLVLGIFGDAFRQGAMPLAIICLSLVVRSASGPTALILSFRNRPYASLLPIAAALPTLVVLNILLVPELKIVGAAISALLAITVWSASSWLLGKTITGLDVSVLPAVRKTWRTAFEK